MRHRTSDRITTSLRRFRREWMAAVTDAAHDTYLHHWLATRPTNPGYHPWGVMTRSYAIRLYTRAHIRVAIDRAAHAALRSLCRLAGHRPTVEQTSEYGRHADAYCTRCGQSLDGGWF